MDDDKYILISKIIFAAMIIIISFLSAIYETPENLDIISKKLLCYENSFSGGLFFGLGIINFLPLALEKLSHNFRIEWTYFLALGSYYFLLVIQKVIFSGSDEENKEKELNNNTFVMSELTEITNNNINKEKLSLEQVLKNMNKREMVNNSNKSTIQQFCNISLFFSFCIQGLFEFIALGIQNSFDNIVFIFMALAFHYRIKVFSLSKFLIEKKFSKKYYYLIIFSFSLIVPITGTFIGIIISSSKTEIFEGFILAISVGIFIYTACSDVLTEEFENPDDRYAKFFIAIFGTSLPVILSILNAYF